MTTCKLSDLIGPAFVPVHQAVKSGDYHRFLLAGGRGSGKSSFVSIEMLLLLIAHSDIHGVVLRKVARTMRKTVFPQYQWAVEMLGLRDKFRATVEPMELTYLPTGQKLLFCGADDPGALKSIKPQFGYIALLHFEEWDQYSGPEEVRSIRQSVLRGGDQGWEFCTFNPPKNRKNFANRAILAANPGEFVHRSTYLSVPPEWLGKRFLENAAELKEKNPAAYAHEYLGEPGGTGTAVFENLRLRPISDGELGEFDRIYCGLDWGYYPDPWAFNQMHYDSARKILYIFAEKTMRRCGNRETAQALKEMGITDEDIIIADSAEKKSIQDYKDFGFDCRPARKGPGSVQYSHKWLQSLRSIVIDPARCPDTAREFSEYEYEKDREGRVLGGYPDRNNHHIDAVRYALEPVWRRRGADYEA